jgi:hypothetical protein
MMNYKLLAESGSTYCAEVVNALASLPTQQRQSFSTPMTLITRYQAPGYASLRLSL